MNESWISHSLRAACHVMSCQWHSPCHLCILFHGRTRPGELEIPSTGSNWNRKSHCCTNSIYPSVSVRSAIPTLSHSKVSRWDSLAWRRKGLGFSCQGLCGPGWRQTEAKWAGGFTPGRSQATVCGLGWGSAWGSLWRAGWQPPGKQGQSCTASLGWHPRESPASVVRQCCSAEQEPQGITETLLSIISTEELIRSWKGSIMK